jgi:hypothetical protein
LVSLTSQTRWKARTGIQRYASTQNSASLGTNGKPAPETKAENEPYGTKSTALGDESGYLGNGDKNDWSKSYFGLSAEPFPKDATDILLAPVDPLDVEIKPGEYFLHSLDSI